MIASMLNTKSHPRSDQTINLMRRKGELIESNFNETDGRSACSDLVSSVLDHFKSAGSSMDELLRACEVQYPGSVIKGDKHE